MGLPVEGIGAFLDHLETQSLRLGGGPPVYLVLEQTENLGPTLSRPGLGVRDLGPVQAGQQVRQLVGGDLRFVVEVSFGLGGHFGQTRKDKKGQ